jgi:hypothetical protein
LPTARAAAASGGSCYRWLCRSECDNADNRTGLYTEGTVCKRVLMIEDEDDRILTKEKNTYLTVAQSSNVIALNINLSGKNAWYAITCDMVGQDAVSP